MKGSVAKLKNSGVAGLLLLLIGVCVASMAGVASYYHLALGRLEHETADSSKQMQHQLRLSNGLIESVALTENALQTLLRERDPDVLEKLVGDLEMRQKGLSEQINLLGSRGRGVKAQSDDWNVVCKRILERFLRGERAEANSALVNELMPESEEVMNEVGKVNQAYEEDAIRRDAATRANLESTRRRAAVGVTLTAALIIAGGLGLRRHVARGTGAVAEALGRMTSLRAANEALEARVRERTADIERSNAQMAAIHRTSLDCVFVLDDQWRIVEFNPAAEWAFGCNASEAIGRPIAQFFAPSGTGDFLVSEKGTPLGRQIDVVAKRPVGSTFPAEMAITSARFDGPPIYIASLRDITERKCAEAERDELNKRLLSASRQAGMAEVATGVLHNVGNVLNSVNVSATVVVEKLRQSEVASLARVGEMITAHQEDLGHFLTADERGKLVPGFIIDLAKCLGEEQSEMLSELSRLAKGIEHIKETVSAQQSLAKKGAVSTVVDPAELMETAMSMQGGALLRHEIEVVRRFEQQSGVLLDSHKVLQVLINLISNAKHAVKSVDKASRRITLTVERHQGNAGRRDWRPNEARSRTTSITRALFGRDGNRYGGRSDSERDFSEPPGFSADSGRGIAPGRYLHQRNRAGRLAARRTRRARWRRRICRQSRYQCRRAIAH